MFKAISNLFMALATLFNAVNRGATAIDHWASWAEQEAADFEARAKIERSARINALEAEISVIPKTVSHLP